MPDDSRNDLADAAALWAWRPNQDNAVELKNAAVRVMVAGGEGEWLAILAGIDAATHYSEFRDSVDRALEEAGLPAIGGDRRDQQPAVARAIARRHARGEMTCAEAVDWLRVNVLIDNAVPALMPVMLLAYDYAELAEAGRDPSGVDRNCERELQRLLQ